VTPYYSHAGITIYLGDCREVLPTLGAFDLMLTDPPYGINHPTDFHARGRGKLARCSDYTPVYGDAEPFDPRWLLGHGNAHIIWGANHFAHLLPPVSGWLVWDKERPEDLDQATCEIAWSDCVKGVRIVRHLWNRMMRASHEALCHPTQKPVRVMSWCMSLRWTSELQSVLDPFMGSGTTLVAAKELGRRAVGIEIEERYCEIAARRLSQEILPGINP
jgi:DNA modification methylase